MTETAKNSVLDAVRSKQLTMSETISPFEVSEGQSIVLEWKPYVWAYEDFEWCESAIQGEIADICGTQESGHMCDISVKSDQLPDGKTLTVSLDNGYVTTGIGGSPFDKGRFSRFKEPNGEN